MQTTIAAKILFIISILAALLLTGCAGEAQFPNSGTDAAPTISCAMDASPHQAVYPDGVVRKSSLTQCSDGCYKYTSVSDETVSFGTCE